MSWAGFLAGLVGLFRSAMSIATHFFAYMAGRRHERLDGAEAARKVEREMREETRQHRTTEQTKSRLKDGSF